MASGTKNVDILLNKKIMEEISQKLLLETPKQKFREYVIKKTSFLLDFNQEIYNFNEY